MLQFVVHHSQLLFCVREAKITNKGSAEDVSNQHHLQLAPQQHEVQTPLAA